MFISPIKEGLLILNPPIIAVVEPYAFIRIFVLRECVDGSDYEHNPC